MQVFAKCDDFMEGLCQRLGVPIPPFVLHRRARVSVSREEGEGALRVAITGLDIVEDLSYSFIKVNKIYWTANLRGKHLVVLFHSAWLFRVVDELLLLISSGCVCSVWWGVVGSKKRTLDANFPGRRCATPLHHHPMSEPLQGAYIPIRVPPSGRGSSVQDGLWGFGQKGLDSYQRIDYI